MATVALSGIITPTNVVTATSTTTLTNKTLTSPTLTTPVASTTIGVGAATPSGSGSGITFPATASDSSNANTLDDYEEGIWTPSVGGTATYSDQTGHYVKIGKQVTIWCGLVITSIGTGSTSRILGLPFTNAEDKGTCCVQYYTNLAISSYFISGYIFNEAGTPKVGFITTTGSQTSCTNLPAVLGSGTNMYFTLTYFV
jgi:hypothetical protein